MLFGLPIAQILLFGFALTNEIKKSKMVICDLSKDAATEQIIAKISNSKSFIIKEAIMNNVHTLLEDIVETLICLRNIAKTKPNKSNKRI